jgi:hypothetical protein
MSANSIKVDNAGYIYVCGNGKNASNVAVQSISKWDNSGTIQWQRTITDTISTPIDAAYGITVDNLGSIYVCGSVRSSLSGNPTIASIAKLPDDGSRTSSSPYTGVSFGIYYQISSWTAATSTWTTSNPSLIYTAGASTVSTPSNTVYDRIMITDKVTI